MGDRCRRWSARSAAATAARWIRAAILRGLPVNSFSFPRALHQPGVSLTGPVRSRRPPAGARPVHDRPASTVPVGQGEISLEINRFRIKQTRLPERVLPGGERFTMYQSGPK
ncbi:hypothetical protein GCM10009544_01070 [Streptomyces stramineus]|uniref:Uncharacterized protein n=1 Tax=Streptomyces stramineus TaxID=173861 RepID=A0ABN0ZB51_9ACTN